MVLDDVAHRADRVVEVAAVGDVEVLAHRDLHARDELPVPDGLEDRVREAQIEDVLDGHLPEEVVDPVELRLVDQRVQLGVEGACGGEVVAERLLDDDPRIRGETRLREPADDRAEQGRRDLEVEDRPRGTTDRRRHLGVRRCVGEVAVDIRQALGEPSEHLVVELLARRDDGLAHALDELVERPVVERDPHDGAREEPASLEPVQRPVGHHPREVARDPEDHEDVSCSLGPPRLAHRRIIPRCARAR